MAHALHEPPSFWRSPAGMFPVLVLMYVRLAVAEEGDSLAAFGQAWSDHAAVTPRFVPRWGQREDSRPAHIH